MEAVKLDAREVEAVRELTKYAKELYAKYENFAKDIRALKEILENYEDFEKNIILLKEIPKNYEELKGNSCLLACELHATTQLRVSKKKRLVDRNSLTSRAGFIDIMFARLYAITHFASLIEPYVNSDIESEIRELSYKMRKVARTIVK